MELTALKEGHFIEFLLSIATIPNPNLLKLTLIETSHSIEFTGSQFYFWNDIKVPILKYI